MHLRNPRVASAILVTIVAAVLTALTPPHQHQLHAEQEPFTRPWTQGTLANSDAPVKPTGLTATMSGSSVVFTWIAPGSNADVSGYRIYRSFHVDHLVTLRILDEKVTTYTDKPPPKARSTSTPSAPSTPTASATSPTTYPSRRPPLPTA